MSMEPPLATSETDAKRPGTPPRAASQVRTRSQFANTSRTRGRARYGSSSAFHCSCDENQKPRCAVTTAPDGIV